MHNRERVERIKDEIELLFRSQRHFELKCWNKQDELAGVLGIESASEELVKIFKRVLSEEDSEVSRG